MPEIIEPVTQKQARPTINDVATLAGTSKATVSFVMNGRHNVAAATRDRVLAAAAELGWTPSQQARSLSNSRAYAIGLVFARPPETLGSDAFFARFIAGVESALADADQSLLLRFVADPAAEQDAYGKLRTHGRVDGVVLTDVRHHDSRIAFLADLGLPAVTLNRTDAPSPFPAVSLDDERGTRDAVDYLVGLGHRRIAYVGGPEIYLHSTRRRLAWQGALETHGLAAHVCIETDFSASSGARAVHEVLALPRHQQPTAIIYANDSMAIAGVVAARQAGLRVPQDLSIVGFDDAELSAHINPPLTTIRSDSYGWGRTAAEVLLQFLHTGDKPPERMLPPAELVIRQSAGPCLGGDD
ncbi:LacI family DNA-binding transcriptional regulator [Pengzhenrongella frigida]|uniref:LacI family transcriptional regulator n=1 Tax=Pengzhenrongella frigida TaxID=1259133 RepID=A0A4Q5N3W3_9MICO|nr:LacI family DNA-binding transcriptional regulator [Cellulomonas sp. HLT2-17]RYV52932.1 LacI family transcriptional regulator [Cellulomonas sp. HLT2-17]